MSENKKLSLGIDVGSTTVKVVLREGGFKLRDIELK